MVTCDAIHTRTQARGGGAESKRTALGGRARLNTAAHAHSRRMTSSGNTSFISFGKNATRDH